MSIEFTIEQPFSQPPDRVFAALTDLEGVAHWMPGFVRIERLTDGAFGLGTEWRETRKMFGREATEQFEVTMHEPPGRLVLRIDGTKGSSRKGEYLFEYGVRPANEGGSILTMHGEIRGLGPVARFIGKLMIGSLRKACLKDLQALAAHLGDQSTIGKE